MAGLVLAIISIHSATTGRGAMGQSSFRVRWEYPTAPHLPLSIVQDDLNRPYLYVAQKSGGLLVLALSNPATRPSKVSVIARAQLGQLDVMSVTQRGDYLCLALGNFFDNQGAKAGLAVVSVKNPRRPQVVSLWTSDEKLHGSAFVLVDQNYAYLAAMNEGVFIFDISNEEKARFVSAIKPDPNFPRPNPGKVQRPNARGLAIRQNLLFVAYDAGGLRVIDVADKLHPKEIAKYINGRMGTKQAAYNNIVLNGPYAYIAADYCGMEVLDIGNPKQIRPVGWWNPWGCQTPTNIWFNSPGHTNQLALDVRQKLVFLSAGDRELQVVDVSVPSRPRLVNEFGEVRNKLGVWGVTVTADTVYLNYTTAFIPFQGTWAGIKALGRQD